MDAENISKDGCSQRDSAEHEGYVRAHRSFNRIWKERDSAQPELLEKILERENLNRAFKRVKANKGAPGVDGMTIDETLQWLRGHNHELTERISRGKYTPKPVRRVEIPKPDGGMRKLGIPTVIDRTIQQASVPVSARQLLKPPCTERYARWWCAAKAARWMREGPSAGIDRQTRQITLRRSVKEAG